MATPPRRTTLAFPRAAALRPRADRARLRRPSPRRPGSPKIDDSGAGGRVSDGRFPCSLTGSTSDIGLRSPDRQEHGRAITVLQTDSGRRCAPTFQPGAERREACSPRSHRADARGQLLIHLRCSRRVRRLPSRCLGYHPEHDTEVLGSGPISRGARDKQRQRTSPLLCHGPTRACLTQHARSRCSPDIVFPGCCSTLTGDTPFLTTSPRPRAPPGPRFAKLLQLRVPECTARRRRSLAYNQLSTADGGLAGRGRPAETFECPDWPRPSRNPPHLYYGSAVQRDLQPHRRGTDRTSSSRIKYVRSASSEARTS